MIPNVLAERYASPAISEIWSAEGRIILEREFWIAVMKAQKDLGLDIPQEAIDAYESVKDQVNLPSIMERERVHPSRCQSSYRRVLRSCRASAYPQGHDLP